MMMPIKHAAHFLNGAAFKPSDWGEEGLPILRIAQLTGKPFDNYFNGTINRGLLIKNGDLLFSWSATIDAFIWERGDAILNQHIFKVFPKKIADKNYLYYLIKAHAPRWAEDDAHGSTMRHIKKGSLSNKVWVPDLSTQQRIAAFLNGETARIDELISKKERLVEVLSEKISVEVETKLADLSLDLHTRLRFVLQRIEQGWSPQCEDRRVEGEEWAVLKLGAITSGYFIAEEHKALPSELVPIPAYRVKAKDVLVARASGSPKLVGKACYVDEISGNLMISDKHFRLVPNLGRIRPRYLAMVVNSQRSRSQIENSLSAAEGMARNIGQGVLYNLRCPVPNLAEQNEILAHVQANEGIVLTLQKKALASIDRLREYRAALITDAVTGQIDVETYGKAAATSATLDQIEDEMHG